MIRLRDRDARAFISALFGGAITSILFNIPGEAWSVATTLTVIRWRSREGGRSAYRGVHVVVHRLAWCVLLITFIAPVASLRCGSGRRNFAVYLPTFCRPASPGPRDKRRPSSDGARLPFAAIGMDTVSEAA
jgi:hypothetical protein